MVGAKPQVPVLSLNNRCDRALLDGLLNHLLFEMRYGVAKSDRRARSEASLEAFLSLAVTPWPFEPEDAVHAADIRAELEGKGTPIGHYDYLIAAQARRRGATLVTANIREFARVPGLLVTNWVV